jgi:hypothetical protein
VAVQASGQAGLLYVAPLISLGLVLADSERLTGFGPVVTRLRAGEPSAFAELAVAAGLVRIGYPPTLEPPLGESVLDSVVNVDGRSVYIEVISPDTSAEMRAAREDVSQLATALVTSTAGTHTEVLLVGDPEGKHAAIAAAAARAPVDEQVHELPGIGQVRRSANVPNVAPNLGPIIPNPDPRPVLACGRGQFNQDGGASATVRVPMTDNRAQRLLSAELHHFSRDEGNLLVVAVTRVPGGLDWWLPLVQRWFRPGRNTRVGGVALYDEGLVGAPLAARQRWRVVANPYARVRLPDALLEALRHLDESPAWRGGGAP